MAMLMVQFIVACVIAGIFLYVLQQFPTLDATVVKFIRLGILVLLSLMFVHVILMAFFGHGLVGIMRQ